MTIMRQINQNCNLGGKTAQADSLGRAAKSYNRCIGRRVIPHFTLLVGLHVSGFVVRPAMHRAGRPGNETR